MLTREINASKWAKSADLASSIEKLLPLPWTPRWYQKKLWNYMQHGGLRAYVVAHRRWGKDDVALNWTCYAAHQRVGSYWHCLPQYGQARRAIWTSVNPHTGRRRIDEAFPIELRDKTLENEMFIRFKNGSTWQLTASDTYNNLVGAGIAGVTFSEWALCNPASYGYIQPMLIENGGWAMMITTPRGRNHAYNLYHRAKKSMESDGEWFCELQSVIDTGAMDDAALREALVDYQTLFGSDIGTAQYRQEYLCDWQAAILGAYYAVEMRQLRERDGIRHVLPMPNNPVHRTWDIGVKDDTSIIWFQVQGGKPVIIDAYSASGVGVDHYAEVIHKRGWQVAGSIDWVPHDAAVKEWGSGRTRVESMIAEGLNPRFVTMASKADGIQAARRTLKTAIFDPSTADTLVSALEQYRREWDDDKKTFRVSEVRDWTTHLSDAFRYLSLAWQATPEVVQKQDRKQPTGTVLLEGAPKPASNKRIKV